jgi:hypothetical protein
MGIGALRGDVARGPLAEIVRGVEGGQTDIGTDCRKNRHRSCRTSGGHWRGLSVLRLRELACARTNCQPHGGRREEQDYPSSPDHER